MGSPDYGPDMVPPHSNQFRSLSARGRVIHGPYWKSDRYGATRPKIGAELARWLDLPGGAGSRETWLLRGDNARL